MNEPNRNLASGFLKAALQFPVRPALEVEGQTLSYIQLKARAASLAATLAKHLPDVEPSLTAVFGYRSITAFAAVLGALLRGHGYVPLNRTFPPDRTRLMLHRSGCRAVIVDAQSEPQLDQILFGFSDELVVVLPHREDVRSLTVRWPQHRFLGCKDLEPPETWRPKEVSRDAIAYLLFTSGSTGLPKGVMVAHRNVLHYVDYVTRRYAISELDRLSQTFDMTFDLSAHDMFVAWENGACVCCPDQKQLINPGNFINNSRLTMWFSVPSTGIFMKRLGMLKAGKYPNLRLSLFCGEALPVEVVKAWTEAAPGSAIENIYGPTELTIACTAYHWNPVGSPAECEVGVVPIGEPFDGMEALIVDESLREVKPGADGELLMTGPQLSLGYWRDPEKTALAFLVPSGKDRIYYRTGDRVRRCMPGKPMVYLGRVDNQIKVLGHRVELGEIEALLRQELDLDGIVAVGWPVSASGAGGVDVFVEADKLDTSSLQTRLAQRLPSYMVPRRIHFLPQLPLNPNGKYDRKALLQMLTNGL